MARFNAAEAVEALEVDFSAYGGPVGVVPEPSGKQIEEWSTRLRGLKKRRGKLIKEGEALVEEGDDDKIDEYLDKLDDEEIKSESAAIFGWMEDVSSGYLQADMLENLPPRVWAAFLRWFSGELSPKANA